MISNWKSFLRGRAVDWNVPGDEAWSFLLHNNYQPHYSQFNLFWFHANDKFPRVVTKSSRDAKILQQEFENMRQLYPECNGVVPRPLHFGLQGNLWMLWMEGIPGQRLDPKDSFSPAILRTVSASIRQIHAATRKPNSSFGPDRHRRMVAEPLRTLSQYGLEPAVLEGCAALEGRIASDWVDALPAIPQHGDFVASNLLSARKRWYVVDWESYGLIDLPLYDLFTFCISALRESGSTPAQWPTATVDEIKDLIDSYCQAIGLTAADARLLLPLTFANWFHIQWEDGRRDFCEQMYKQIAQYFEHKQRWEELVLPRSERQRASTFYMRE